VGVVPQIPSQIDSIPVIDSHLMLIHFHF